MADYKTLYLKWQTLRPLLLEASWATKTEQLILEFSQDIDECAKGGNFMEDTNATFEAKLGREIASKIKR